MEILVDSDDIHYFWSPGETHSLTWGSNDGRRIFFTFPNFHL
jgi:hypothetical protein